MTIEEEFLNSTEAIFMTARHFVVEYFDDSGLVLNLRNRSMIALDAQESQVVKCLNGQSTLNQLVDHFVGVFGISREQTIRSVMATCEKLFHAQAIQLLHGKWKGESMNDIQYLQNPDVNLREEDEDGALLFNPDTDRVQLVNNTGLFIWKFCSEKHTIDQIVVALEENFEDIPTNAVAADVEEFINQMVGSGFIGTVEPSIVGRE
jgi:hypothetical protein